MRDLLDAAGATAGVAGDGSRARSGAVASAGVAGLGHARRHADGDPGVRLRERDLGTRDDIATTRRPTAARLLAEEGLTEERAEDVGEIAEVEVRRRVPPATEPLAAVPVVGGAAFRVGQDLVRLGRLAEALLGIRLLGNVGMELARELAERPLDLGVRGAPVDAQDLVVVALGRRHQAVEGTGRAGRYCRAYSSS